GLGIAVGVDAGPDGGARQLRVEGHRSIGGAVWAVEGDDGYAGGALAWGAWGAPGAPQFKESACAGRGPGLAILRPARSRGDGPPPSSDPRARRRGARGPPAARRSPAPASPLRP